MFSDQEIISMVVSGKAEAFEDLVARYQKPVFRLAVNILGNRDDAEDAAQEVFIRVYKNAAGYLESGKLWGWLRRITVNVCLKMCRPKPVTYIEESDELPGLDGDAVFESISDSMEQERIRRMIAELPSMYRSVIVLKYLEDMSYAEIAETLGESVSNIQVRIFRAKQMMRQRMKVSDI